MKINTEFNKSITQTFKNDLDQIFQDYYDFYYNTNEIDIPEFNQELKYIINQGFINNHNLQSFTIDYHQSSNLLIRILLHNINSIRVHLVDKFKIEDVINYISLLETNMTQNQ